MAKSNSTIARHVDGNKGNILIERIQPTNLDKVMVVPIEVAKDSHKALMANYFGFILKGPFEFHSSQEGINFLHNTICEVSRDHGLEKVLISMEATGHYYKKPASGIYELVLLPVGDTSVFGGRQGPVKFCFPWDMSRNGCQESVRES